MPIGREWWKIRLRGENASVGNDEEFHPDQEREHAAGVPRDACDLETDECRQHVVQIGRDVGVLNLVEAGYGEGTQVLEELGGQQRASARSKGRRTESTLTQRQNNDSPARRPAPEAVPLPSQVSSAFAAQASTMAADTSACYPAGTSYSDSPSESTPNRMGDHSFSARDCAVRPSSKSCHSSLHSSKVV